MTTEIDRGLSGQQLASSLEMYSKMFEVRYFEECVLELRSRDEIAGSVHPCMGQEAVPVGAARALEAGDQVVATYRGHGWALCSGLEPEELLAEILGRANGVNGGRAGSAYVMAPDRGFIGENSIVGAGLPIANGLALASELLGGGNVAVVSFGDGATNQGAAHEALVFAVARRLPVIFVCENNGWSEMTPITATVPAVGLADRAAAYGMPAEVLVDPDPAAVFAAVSAARARAIDGGGPTFLECVVPRLKGHYNADIEHYRDAADRQAAEARDPLSVMRNVLLDGGVGDDDLVVIEENIRRSIDEAVSAALAQPLADPRDAVRSELDAVPAPSELPGEGAETTYGLAVNAALTREMTERDEMVIFGEDIAIPGGVFGVTRNLLKRFGPVRVFDTPISEAAILGAGIGAAQRGLRPVVEIMWMDFLLVALDQLVNQAANVRFVTGGASSVPLVVRTQQGATPGSCSQHSQSLEAILAHIPGLCVGLPSNPHDAYVMTRAAIAHDDPVILIESRAMYGDKGPVDEAAHVEPVGGARTRRVGSDALIVTWGRMTNRCLAAADQLAAMGVDVGVVDVRWLRPLDFDTIARAIAPHAGRVLIVHEANVTGGFGAEIAARIASECLFELDAPIARLGTPDSRIPAAPTLQDVLIPSKDDIMNAVQKLVGH